MARARAKRLAKKHSEPVRKTKMTKEKRRLLDLLPVGVVLLGLLIGLWVVFTKESRHAAGAGAAATPTEKGIR